MTSQHQLARIEGKIDLLLDAAGLQLEMEENMTAAGEALQAGVERINADEQTELAEIKTAGEAVVAAGVKFAELKALLEKQSTGALSDEEAQKLELLTGEVDAHIAEGTTALGAHVAQLNEESGAAKPEPAPAPTPEPTPEPTPAPTPEPTPAPGEGEGPPAA